MLGREDFANITDRTPCAFPTLGAVARPAPIAIGEIWRVGVVRSSDDTGSQGHDMPSDLAAVSRGS